MDRAIILEQLKQILNYNSFTPLNDKYIEKLFTLWEKRKGESLIPNLFKDNLILKYDLQNFSLQDYTSRSVQIDRNIFIDTLKEYTDKYQALENIILFLDTRSFVDNKLGFDFAPGLTKGMRLTKAIRKCVPNDKDADEIINLYSRIVQNYRIDGYLCISIHPFDYLTISENNSNWRSCHALIDGEYRAGNLSYLCDNSTVVAYICSKEEKQLDSFPDGIKWNDKKWRVLLHFDKDLQQIIVNKQYPYTNDELIIKLKNVFFNNYATLTPISRSQLSDIIKTHIVYNTNIGEASLFYNDLWHSSSNFTPYLIQKNYNDKLHKITIGAEVPCLKCGHELNITDDFRCSYCNDNYSHCSCCDTPVRVEDYYYVNGEILCESCYDAEVAYCDACGCELLISDEGQTHVITEDWSRLCMDCYGEYLHRLEEEEEEIEDECCNNI